MGLPCLLHDFSSMPPIFSRYLGSLWLSCEAGLHELLHPAPTAASRPVSSAGCPSPPAVIGLECIPSSGNSRKVFPCGLHILFEMLPGQDLNSWNSFSNKLLESQKLDTNILISCLFKKKSGGGCCKSIVTKAVQLRIGQPGHAFINNSLFMNLKTVSMCRSTTRPYWKCEWNSYRISQITLIHWFRNVWPKEENNHQIQFISNMASYKSVKLQRKYFYISVQLELSQHFYWFMGPELEDKPEELTLEARSYIFKKWG